MENKNFNSIKFHYTNSRFAPDDTAKGLFLFLIIQTLVTLVYQVLYLVGLVQSIWSYVFTLILDFCFVLSVYNVSKSKKTNFFENVKVKKAPNIKEVLICLLISLVCIFGFSALTNLFLELLYRAGYASVTSDIVIPNFGYYLMYVVLICVAPAICEEVLFRGLICNGLKKISTSVAVFGSAFLFMIMHGSPDQTVHQFILGIILALAFLISNNLWVPILIHFFNNFIAVTFSFVAYGDSVATDTATETAEIFLGEYLIYAVISAVISGFIVYFLLKALSKAKTKKEEIEPVELKTNPILAQDKKINFSNEFDYDASKSIDKFNSAFVRTPIDEVNNQATLSGNSLTSGEGENPEIQKDPVFITPENKFSGTGKAMLIISIIWLAMDWISALISGFTQLY